MTWADRLEIQLVKALQNHLETKSPPRLPAAGVPLWRAFLDLDATRTLHRIGPNPISHAEIEAWARLNRWPLQPHHVQIIRALDAALLYHFHEKTKGPPDGMRALPQRSSQPLSPGLFDVAIG